MAATGLDIITAANAVHDVAGTGGEPDYRFVSVTYHVRNARTCGSPGNCMPYGIERSNLAFIAAATPTSLAQSGIARLERFDGSPLPNAAALARQLMPTHGMTVNGAGNLVVNAPSLVVYREAELPAPVESTTNLLPYGYLITNRHSPGSRTLAANPAAGQYDGAVTFALRIPKNPDNTLNPFRIVIRFQAVSDPNIRVVQSREEQDFAGDQALTARALEDGAHDRIVLGGRIAQVANAEGICSVRTAGTAASPTDWLVTEGSGPPRVVAAPMNLTGYRFAFPRRGESTLTPSHWATSTATDGSTSLR